MRVGRLFACLLSGRRSIACKLRVLFNFLWSGSLLVSR